MGESKADFWTIVLRSINVHLAWALCTISALMIWMFSVDKSDDENFVGAVSLALGVSSLIVGVYAIFQALFSSKSLADTVTALHNSSDIITDTARKIEVASDSLSEKISSIPIRLDSLDSKIDEIRSQAQRKVSTSISPENSPADTSNDNIGRFMENLSRGGSVALYCCYASHLKGTPFDTNEVFHDDEFMASYVSGFIGCMDSAGLITVSIGDDDLTFEIGSLGKFSGKEIAKDIRDASRGSPYILSCKKQIDVHFGLNSAVKKP